MAERIINPDDYLSDIVATRRWAYLDDDGHLRFTDDLVEAQDRWHASVIPGDYVPKTLPLNPPLDWYENEPPFPGPPSPADDAVAFVYPAHPADEDDLMPGWLSRLKESRNGVEVVVASIMGGTAGALIGWALAHAG
jgi:hypothetical protein